MADVAAAPAKKATKTKKVAKAPAAHPSFDVMVAAALASLKDRKGSSAIAIKKYIVANYKVEEDKCRVRISKALKRGLTSGALKQAKGTTVAGSFKLADKETKPKKTVAKKTTATKAKKTTKSPKKVAKKPTATKTKKSPKKSTTKTAKATAKKPAAKKVVKKTTKKTTAKK